MRCTSSLGPKTAVRLVLGLACTMGFLAMSWNQLLQFLGGQTSVSRRWEGAETRKFPLLVFCPRNPFLTEKPPDMETLRFNQEIYDVSVAKLNI